MWLERETTIPAACMCSGGCFFVWVYREIAAFKVIRFAQVSMKFNAFDRLKHVKQLFQMINVKNSTSCT